MNKRVLIVFSILSLFSFAASAQDAADSTLTEASTESIGLVELNGEIGQDTETVGPTPDVKIQDEKPSAEDRPSWKLTGGAKSFEVELGFAPMQPTFLSGEKEYDTAGRKFAMASARFSRVIGTKGPVTYQYLFEVIPAAFAFKNEVRNPAYSADNTQSKTIRRDTFAVGIQPVGFRFLFKPDSRWKPYAQVGAGFLFSNKPIPVPESTTYNFIGDFGGGVMYSVSRKRAINFGYRYFHISNMNIGPLNPGYNANVFYIGYSFFNK